MKKSNHRKSGIFSLVLFFHNFELNKNLKRLGSSLLATTSCLCLLLISMGLLPQIALSEVSIVNTSTSSSATAHRGNERTFRDDVSGSQWVFYYNGSGIEYSYSTDNSFFTSAGIIAVADPDFSLTQKRIGDTLYVFLAVTSNFDIKVYRGTTQGNAITFDSPVSVFDGEDAADGYTHPSIVLDSNNNLWVAAVYTQGQAGMFNQVINVRRSVNVGTADIADWQVSTALGPTSALIKDLILVPLTEANLYLVVNTEVPNIVGYRFNGTAWEKANQGGGNGWFNMGLCGVNGSVRAIVASGNDIYFGGEFTVSGGSATSYIAHWNGSAWEDMDGVIDGPVFALALLNGELYAGGAFMTPTTGIARWDGESWHAVSSGVDGTVRSIAQVGSDLYVGGDFNSVGGDSQIKGIAKWDGVSWSKLGDGIPGSVYAIASFQSKLYIGGEFTDVAGNPDANRLVRWNGSSYEAVVAGVDAPVYALLVAGSYLYIGGSFSDLSGDENADRLARYNGTAFSAVGQPLNGTVWAIETKDNIVYVGGSFKNINGQLSTNYAAAWNGTSWSGLGSGMQTDVEDTDPKVVYALEAGIEGIYVGGDLISIASLDEFDYLAEYKIASNSLTTVGGGWHSLEILSMSVHQGMLYLGGRFCSGVVGWDGSDWFGLGAGLRNQKCTEKIPEVHTLEWDGDTLYAGGEFAYAVNSGTGIVAESENIARWDGSAWSAVAGGLPGGPVFSIRKLDGVLWAGGGFSIPETTEELTITIGPDQYMLPNKAYLVKLVGNQWERPLTNKSLSAGYVRAIAKVNNLLYVGGDFQDVVLSEPQLLGPDPFGGFKPTPDPIPGEHNDAIVALDLTGETIVELYRGIEYGTVYCLTVQGNRIWIGGAFNDAGTNVDADNIATWDTVGLNWGAIGQGLNGPVRSITLSGQDIYVTGGFTDAGGRADNDAIARWDGTRWNTVTSPPVTGTVNSMAIIGDLIYAGGMFTKPEPATMELKNVARFGPLVASGTDTTTSISTLVTNSGNIHLIYTDASRHLKYKYYQASLNSWGPAILLDIDHRVFDPKIGIVGEQLVAFYRVGDNIWGTFASSPYAQADWNGNSLQVSDDGDATNPAVTTVGSEGNSLLVWTRGVADPYQVVVQALVDLDQDGILDVFDSDVRVYDISGTVTIGSNPLTGVTLTGSGSLGTRTTDSSGFFRFSDIPSNTSYTITPSKTGYAFTPSSGSGTLTQDLTLNFSAKGAYTISGKVTVGGNALSGVSVKGSGSLGSKTTDSKGNYKFADVAPGVSYTLTPSKAGHTFTPAKVSGSVSGNTTKNFTATINTYSLSGVVTHEGSPLSGVKVTGSGSLGSKTTNSAGQYSFASVPYGTSYTLTPSKTGYLFSPTAATGTISNNATKNFSASLKDTDGDGVTDLQEAVDGTNPNDAGSYVQELQTTLCSEWNSFLGIINVMEHVNVGASTINVTSKFYSISGKVLSEKKFSVRSNNQFDLIVNDMQGFVADSYGKVCSTITKGVAGDLDGRMVYYKSSEAGDFQFAFAMPFGNGLAGRQYVQFDTFPYSATNNLVTNWIQVTNLEATSQSGKLVFYSSAGATLKTQSIKVSAGARADISAHQFGASQIGLVEWIPSSGAARFQIRNVRYYYDNPAGSVSFDAAFQYEGMKGSGEKLVVPFDNTTMAGTLLLSNASGATASVTVKVFDANGAVSSEKKWSIGAYRTVNVGSNGASSLPTGKGIVTLDSDKVGSIIATFTQPTLTGLSTLQNIYGLYAIQPLGSVLKGSYNTFIGQGCSLLLSNPTGSSVNTSLSMRNVTGAQPINGTQVSVPANRVVDYDLCSKDSPNLYGVVTVQPAKSNTIVSTVIRRGQADNYRFVTPVR